MRFYDPLLFLTGHRGAIGRIASARHAWVVGAVLVLTAGIARNYDHLDLLRQPEWFIGPFGASLVSIVFIYLWIAGPLKLAAVGTAWRQLGTFLTFAWMTAPCAWLYGIPVESMTDLLTATKWNVAFLAIVALWRVLLMMRTLAVMTGVTHARAFVLILAPAALEAAVGSFFKGMSLVQIMGGVRLPPHTEWLREATSAVWLISSVVFFISLLLCGFFKGQAKAPLHRVGAGGVRGGMTMAVASLLLWALIAVPRQHQTANQNELKRLIRSGDLSAAVAYASARQRTDFLAVHEFPGGSQAPELLKLVTPETPRWLREEWISATVENLKDPFRFSIRDGKWREFEGESPEIARELAGYAAELRNRRESLDENENSWLEQYERAITPPTPEDPIDPK